MTAVRLQVLVWHDDSGLCHGVLTERPEIAAVAATPSDVISQIREYLMYVLKEESWDFPYEPMAEPRLRRLNVEVRPEYADRGRRFPVEHPVRMSFPGVLGEYPGGMKACVIPTLGLWFSFDDEDRLAELAQHYVAEALRGSTPQRVARFVPPLECELRSLVINAREDAPSRQRPQWPALEAVAEPLGERSQRRRLSRAFEREPEISELVRRLHKDRASVLLVGEPGIGKTALLASAVREIERAQARESQEGSLRLFWQTAASRLIAGMQYLGQWEERLETVIANLADFDGVLCVENLLELVRIGGVGAADSVGAFLVPYLRHRELRLVGEATPEELDACRRLLPSLVDSMQVQRVKPFDAPTGQRVLTRLAEAAARNLRAEYATDVPLTLARLYRRFAPYEAFPGKPAAMLQRLLQDAAVAGRRLDVPEVLQGFTRQTGLPEFLLRDELPLRVDELHRRLARRVMGQDAACRAASALVTTFKAGMNDPARPLGVLLFAGPTGVGKTELAKALADELFGHGTRSERLIRLDMSEYAAADGAIRLVADASGESSELIRRVREQPFCLVLLDEVEKAAPEVFDLLLGVFDEGRLTDRFGRVTNFRSSVIVMTSNLGATQEDLMGFGTPRQPDYSAAIMRHFRPEFFNRLDAVVPFAPLEQATILAIAEKELQALALREGLVRGGGTLRWTVALSKQVAAAGFDRRFGARPLQRAVENLVVIPLARRIAQEPVLASQHLLLDLDAAHRLVVSTG